MFFILTIFNEHVLTRIAVGESIYYQNILQSTHKDRGQVIVCCDNIKIIDINDIFIKAVDNQLKLHVLKTILAHNNNEID